MARYWSQSLVKNPLCIFTLKRYNELLTSISRGRRNGFTTKRGKRNVFATINVCRRGINKNDPHYYGVSLFLNRAPVENALKFPKPNKKIAQGKVYAEAGPIEVNLETGHICWWIYDEVEINGFSIC